MKKMGIAILSMCLCAIASYLIVYSVSPNSDDMVYDIDSDVDLLYISPGPSVPQYRYNATTGTWQRQSTIGAPWYDASTTTLTQMLNDLGVATIADLPTSTTFVDSLKSYFGSDPIFPGSMQWFANDAQGPLLVSTDSLLAWLNAFAYYLSYDLITDPGWTTIGYNGDYVTTSSSTKFTSLLNTGIAGIASLLGGYSNFDTPVRYLSYTGSLTSATGGYLSHVSESIAGLGSLLFSTSGNGLDPSGIYPVGYPGEDPGLPKYNLAQYLGYYLSSIQRPLVTQLDWLDSNGETQANKDQLNVGIAEITADGFLGLATILRGSAEPWAQEYTKINYADLSEQTVTVDNILDAIIWPLSDLQHDFAQYLYSHGTDLDIKERENMEQQAEQFVDDFTDPDGQGTPTTGQISDTAGVSGGIKDAFSGSSSPADAFTQITDSDNYSFLSSQTQSELNPFYSSRSRSSDIVDFVGPKLNEIQSGVGSSW